ncbi:MAG TPA: hypothetical protein VNU19_07560, partial [Candidatus Acidoferrum sp.]|nr:hypothetical protein [Candidatus Acidoferrum sp.]
MTQTAKASATPTSAAAPGLTSADLGVVAANIACQDIDVAASYWAHIVVLHGVDVEVIKENPTTQSIDNVERTQVSEAHVALAEAATDDSRWADLKQIMSSSESAAITLWDRGGLTPIQAVTQAVGNDVDTVHGICAAAKAQLIASAQSRHETADVHRLVIDHAQNLGTAPFRGSARSTCRSVRDSHRRASVRAAASHRAARWVGSASR